MFGKKIQAAVIQFQKDNGLKADGIVGNQTLTVLKTASSTKDAPDYVKSDAMNSAKKSKSGGINDSTILMSSDTFNGKLKQIETIRKTTGGIVNTTVKNNEVVVTGVTVKKTTAPKPTETTKTVTVTTGSGAKPPESVTNKIEYVKEKWLVVPLVS